MIKNKYFFPILYLAILFLIFCLEIGFNNQAIKLESFIESAIYKYGIGFVLLISVLENTVVLNAAFPGSVALLAIMIYTKGTIDIFMLNYIAVIVGAYIGQTASYYWGQFTLNKTGEKLQEPTLKEYLLTYWHPQIGSIVSMRTGQSNIKFKIFIFYLSVTALPWSIFWALILYIFLDQVNFSETLLPLGMVYCLIWLLIEYKNSTESL